MAYNKTYEDFVEKFKPKRTTDDCYTPPIVYDAVAKWVSNEYNLNSDDFVRPFYPGGDYQNTKYKQNDIVVDNPPFSILSQIVKFYVQNNIKFFLFAPTLVGITRYSDLCTALVIGVSINYENGAVVNTSFVTNLENNDIRMKTAPSLYRAVDEANKKQIKLKNKQLPKYIYPNEVVTTAAIYPYNKYDIEFTITRGESKRISWLDAQIPMKKSIFGGGFLISERLSAEREKAEREKAEREKAEREKAEREKAERFELSKKEKEVIKSLSCKE